jgi:hypothetical protein
MYAWDLLLCTLEVTWVPSHVPQSNHAMNMKKLLGFYAIQSCHEIQGRVTHLLLGGIWRRRVWLGAGAAPATGIMHPGGFCAPGCGAWGLPPGDETLGLCPGRQAFQMRWLCAAAVPAAWRYGGASARFRLNRTRVFILMYQLTSPLAIFYWTTWRQFLIG